ncbi:MAG: hypothetical protein ABEJ86_01590 [Halococcoides sp.]
MDLKRVDLAVFVYNVAVVASGAAIVTTLQIESAVTSVAVAVVLGAVWTIYVRMRLLDHLLELESRDASEDDRNGDPGEGGDVDPPWGV